MLGYNRLQRRNHSYYIRARVPDSLRFIAKASEIKYSLHTNNFWEALELLRKESYKIDLKLKLFKDMAMLIKDHKILLDDKDIDKLITHKLTLQIIGSIAEFERNMIKMRQKEGIAKQKGVYNKERCKKLSLTQQDELKNDINNKVRVCEILKKYGITKPTYYRYKENFGL